MAPFADIHPAQNKTQLPNRSGHIYGICSRHDLKPEFHFETGIAVIGGKVGKLTFFLGHYNSYVAKGQRFLVS
jgi:hypothetical protein